MDSPSDLKLRILQFALSILALVVSILLITDAQITSVLSLGAPDLTNAPLLLARLRFVFRIALLFFLLLLFTGVFVLVRRRLYGATLTQSVRAAVGVEIVSVDEGLQAAIQQISQAHGTRTLQLWGYSLGWAAKLSQHLEANPQPQLAVNIFVPNESVIGSLFADEKAEERRAVLRLRVGEWKALATSKRVSGVSLFSQNTVPNDLGLMVDQKLALLHTYDWDIRGKRLFHRRQSLERRRFLRVSDEAEVGRYLIEQLGCRLLCRCYDSRVG